MPNLIFWYFRYVPKWYYFHFTWMLDFSGLVISVPVVHSASYSAEIHSQRLLKALTVEVGIKSQELE